MDTDFLTGLIFWIIIIILMIKKAKKRAGKVNGGSKSRPPAAGNSPQFRMPPASGTSAQAAHAAQVKPQEKFEARLQEKFSSPGRNEPASAQHMSIAQLRAGESRDGMSALIEDRQHDWLARQLREERSLWKRGEGLLDLGAAHDASCDARKLKRMHMLQHDDSIDDGET